VLQRGKPTQYGSAGRHQADFSLRARIPDKASQISTEPLSPCSDTAFEPMF
jgi:hypothetical protein